LICRAATESPHPRGERPGELIRGKTGKQYFHKTGEEVRNEIIYIIPLKNKEGHDENGLILQGPISQETLIFEYVVPEEIQSD